MRYTVEDLEIMKLMIRTALAVTVLLTSTAFAQPTPLKPVTLYNFACCDGPISVLINGGKGLLFGTTYNGKPGKGTAFELIGGPNGYTEKVLYNFESDANPSGVIQVGTALYGTAYDGGGAGAERYGSVFELTPPTTGNKWVQTVLYNFMAGADGADPKANVVMGANGSFYGTTSSGGPINAGTVFELTPPSAPGGAWTEKVIYTFMDGSDGGVPLGPLVIAQNGDLFGTTSVGGNTACLGGCGTVFALAPPATAGGAWKFATVYSFKGGADGAAPSAGLVIGTNKVLYGATPYGGTGTCTNSLPYAGCGTISQLTPPASAGAGWTETILHTFTGGADGANPMGALALGSNGALFGTTVAGGSSNLGTTFELTPPLRPGRTWRESLYSFTGMNGDGASPTAGLTLGGGGVLYGSTNSGGTLGGGTAFEITF